MTGYTQKSENRDLGIRRIPSNTPLVTVKILLFVIRFNLHSKYIFTLTESIVLT